MECRKVKEEWIENKCKVEDKLKIGKTDEAHKIIRKNFKEIESSNKYIRNERRETS